MQLVDSFNENRTDRGRKTKHGKHAGKPSSMCSETVFFPVTLTTNEKAY